MTHPIDIGHSHGRALMLAVLALFAAAGCSSTFDDLELKKDTGTTTSCEHAHPPRRPTTPTGEVIGVDFVAAVSEYDLGEVDQDTASERYRTMSYDLDDTCTGQGQGPSCESPSFWIGADPTSDGPEGRDNAHGATLHGIYKQRRSGSATDFANSAIGGGDTITMVIRVRGYNETTLDNQVDVAVFAATMNPKGTTGKAPAWLGNDEWFAGDPWWVNKDENGDPSLEHPVYFDAKAYVTDHTLVARLDELLVPTVRLSHVVITADIVRTAEGGWTLTNGIVAGRAKTDDFLIGLEFIIDDETGNWICRSSKNYWVNKRAICGSSDIGSVKSDDPSTPCDATSWGWRFDALPAKLAGTTGADRMRNCQGDDSPETDSCANHE
jgi:hypothetical protein